MKNFNDSFGSKWAVIVSLFLLFSSYSSLAQLTVNLTAANDDINQCGSVTLTAIVSGGSGSYDYGWSATPTTDAELTNSPTLVASPTALTTFRVFVSDRNTGGLATTTISVVPDLVGNFDVFIPNVFTPNGDGVNDIWEVRDADRAFGPLNAFRYELTIVNRSGTTVFSRSQTITTGTTGLRGGDITWNGRRNGNLLPDGVYFYSLRLINCNRNTNFQGNVSILGGSSLTSEEIVSIYPNPSKDYLEISIMESNDSENFSSQDGFSPYEILIHDKSGNVIHSETIQTQKYRMDVSKLSSDTYYIRGVYNGERFQKRLIIED